MERRMMQQAALERLAQDIPRLMPERVKGLDYQDSWTEPRGQMQPD